jgi:uncharacterized protein (DUF342 family)
MLKLKEILRKLIEEESSVVSIDVTGGSMEEALQNACEELGANLSELDYEIVEFGNKGIFGVGRKDFHLKVYKSKDEQDVLASIMTGYSDGENELDLDTIEDKIVDKDGEAFLRVTNNGIMLKVTKPIGKGRKISEKEVQNIIYTRNITDFDMDMVKKILKQASGEYCKIGSMEPNVVNDSTASVQISTDEMKAYIVMTPPRIGGFDLEMDEVKNILKNNGVVVGIKEDKLEKLMDFPQYNEPILIAEGIKVKNGHDAIVTYNFATDNQIHLKEVDGKVDFKELNIVQNIVAGQILATKEPPSQGEPGRTVTNKLLPASPGKDVPMMAGANTKLTEDKLSIVSEINGQVLIKGGKVVVEPVMTINGDVNLKTGNILFLGTVIVQGNVEDGFSVKAAGNIEIHGSVGKCLLDAEGDIIVSQGVMGKNEGSIHAGKNLYAKFIENVHMIDAGEGVYVQDGILHSMIDAVKEVTCLGKRGAIVGGRLRAGQLVKTKTVGSVNGTETIIEVGIDPKKRQRLMELEEERSHAYKELEPIKVNLDNLENQKKLMKKLPPERQEIYNQLVEESSKLNTIIGTCEDEINDINKYLSMIKTKGKIVGAKIVYPGVKLYIKNANLNIKTEYKKVCFVLQGTEINTLPYIDEKDRRK